MLGRDQVVAYSLAIREQARPVVSAVTCLQACRDAALILMEPLRLCASHPDDLVPEGPVRRCRPWMQVQLPISNCQTVLGYEEVVAARISTATVIPGRRGLLLLTQLLSDTLG